MHYIYVLYYTNDHYYSDGCNITNHDHFSCSLEIDIHNILPSISTKCGWVEVITSLVCYYYLFSCSLEIYIRNIMLPFINLVLLLADQWMHILSYRICLKSFLEFPKEMWEQTDYIEFFYCVLALVMICVWCPSYIWVTKLLATGLLAHHNHIINGLSSSFLGPFSKWKVPTNSYVNQCTQECVGGILLYSALHNTISKNCSILKHKTVASSYY